MVNSPSVEAFKLIFAPITAAANDILKYLFYCSKKISVDISCESFAKQTNIYFLKFCLMLCECACFKSLSV